MLEGYLPWGSSLNYTGHSVKIREPRTGEHWVKHIRSFNDWGCFPASDKKLYLGEITNKIIDALKKNKDCLLKIW